MGCIEFHAQVGTSGSDMHMYMYVCTYVCMYVCMYVCVYIYRYIDLFIFYLFKHTHTDIYIYILHI